MSKRNGGTGSACSASTHDKGNMMFMTKGEQRRDLTLRLGYDNDIRQEVQAAIIIPVAPAIGLLKQQLIGGECML